MRNCLALVGVVFLGLLVLGAALLYTADPEQLRRLLEEEGTPRVAITPLGTPAIQTLPPPTLIPSPLPLPDAAAYRARVLIRARHFAAALEAFMAANTRLQGAPSLIQDPQWRSEVQAALDELVIAAHSLSDFPGVPPEYVAIASWLDQVGPEAESLRSDYLQGVQSGDAQLLARAGERLNRITEYMRLAQVEMAAAGWQP